MKDIYSAIKVTDNVYWVGAIDWGIRDFHGYTTPAGSTYNSYLIMADDVTLIDTVKAPFKDEMLSRIRSVIDPAKIKYIVSNHSEMDHSGCLPEMVELIKPEKVICSKMGHKALLQHFHHEEWPYHIVNPGEELSLGTRTLSFLETRMLHWPDSMFTYVKGDEILFSSDGFYFDKNGKLDLLSEQSIYAATIYKQLAQYSIPGVLAWHHDETAAAVRTKAAPIGTIMSGLANQNHDPEKSKIVDTVKYTTLGGKTAKASANNAFWVWAIAKNSNDIDASFKFISWFTSPAIEKMQTLKNQQISAVSSLSSDPEVLKAAPWLPVVMTQLANGKMDPALKNFQALKDALIVALSAIASTDISPAEALGKAQEQLKAVDFSK